MYIHIYIYIYIYIFFFFFFKKKKKKDIWKVTQKPENQIQQKTLQ